MFAFCGLEEACVYVLVWPTETSIITSVTCLLGPSETTFNDCS